MNKSEHRQKSIKSHCIKIPNSLSGKLANWPREKFQENWNDGKK